MPALKITKADRVARLFKSARAGMGYTQSKLAKRFKTNQATISLWEKNYKRMSVENFELYCKVLGVDPAEVFKIKEE